MCYELVMKSSSGGNAGNHKVTVGVHGSSPLQDMKRLLKIEVNKGGTA